MYENRYQEMESNGEAGPPLNELERLREQAQDRVQDMIQNSTPEALDQAGLQVQELEQLQERLQEQAQVHEGPGSGSTGQGGN
jgi:F0F1-type ATP synthase membrane subunit b/b'